MSFKPRRKTALARGVQDLSAGVILHIRSDKCVAGELIGADSGRYEAADVGVFNAVLFSSTAACI